MPNMYWVVFMLFCYFGIIQNTARHVNITIENHCRILLNNNLIFGKRIQGRPIHLSVRAWMFLLKSQIHSFFGHQFRRQLYFAEPSFFVGHDDVIKVLRILGRHGSLLFLEKTHGPGRTGGNAVSTTDTAIEVDDCGARTIVNRHGIHLASFDTDPTTGAGLGVHRGAVVGCPEINRFGQYFLKTKHPATATAAGADELDLLGVGGLKDQPVSFVQPNYFERLLSADGPPVRVLDNILRHVSNGQARFLAGGLPAGIPLQAGHFSADAFENGKGAVGSVNDVHYVVIGGYLVFDGDAFSHRYRPHLRQFRAEKGQPEGLVISVLPNIAEKLGGEPLQLALEHTDDERYGVEAPGALLFNQADNPVSCHIIEQTLNHV